MTNSKSLCRGPDWLVPLAMLAVALIAFLIYARALDFTFFNDDPTGHFAWMEGRSLTDYFFSSAEYGYYRPVVFVALDSLVTVAGYNAVPFHGLLLLLNSANVAMLFLLMWRLTGSKAYAFAAALIFATLPFSYEAVAYVASLTHPLLLFWLLLSLIFYQAGRQKALTRQGSSAAKWFYVAAYLAMILGLLSHENGLMIPVALMGLDWLILPPRSLKGALKRPFLPYFLAAALYVVLWLSIPKGSDQGLASFSEIGRNSLPFLQTLVAPLLPWISLETADWPLLLLLVLLSLVALFVAASAARAVGLWLFGIAWLLFTSLPALLFLDSGYLYGSPRLHYLPGIGVAILWALPVLALARRKPATTWARTAFPVLQIGYLLLLTIPPLAFIDCQLDFYAESSRITRKMGDLSREVDEDNPLILVNVPFFFSSYAAHPQGCDRTYPWTPIGGIVIPPYAAAADFVRFNGGVGGQDVEAFTVPDYAPGWNTFGPEIPLAELSERLSQASIFVYDLPSGDFFNLSAAWRNNVVKDQPKATFGGDINLVDAEFTIGNPAPTLTVELAWQTTGSLEQPKTVFVHLYDSSGNLVAQHDGPPASGFAPWYLWKADDLIADTHLLQLDSDLPAGTYFLATGIYDPTNGQRVPGATDGLALPDDVYVFGELNLD